MVKEALKDNISNIVVVLFGAVGMYFTVQANTKEIESLSAKIVELENNKVSNSVMKLKEQFLASELTAIDDRITHIDDRLSKKIKLQNVMSDELSCLVTEVAVHEQQIMQAESELDGTWVFINKFLEEL